MDEAGGTVTLRVTRNFAGFATVNYATGDGAANAGADYVAAAGQLQFQSADTFKDLPPIMIREDAVVEGDHSFTVSLSLPSAGSLSDPFIATVTIINNDEQSGA